MKKIFLLFSFALSLPAFLSANPGDTLHVITHNNETVVTNPNTGWNQYANWGVFPSAAVNYRKVLVKMSYKCPSGYACGEWDYIDQIMLRRKGGVDSASLDLEMVRFITPYGNTFNSTWQFAWHADITDFAALLHDSIEIGYVHTGYETNVGKGWAVTLDFELIEGTPVRDYIGYSTLWNTNHVYGDANNPIENALGADTVVSSPNTYLTRVRINHTGHGADAAYCSEFCDKYRDFLFDGNLVERWHRWRKCGFNALYPQGGTWVYDRGNWCPGSVIYPNIYQFNVTPNSTHTYDVNMEPYTTGSPSANEYIVAYLFQYGQPVNANDAGMDEVLRPSTMYEYNRINPMCANPQVIIRNNGSNNLTSAVIRYGFAGGPYYAYNWTGNLATDAVDTVDLPATLYAPANGAFFKAYFEQVNGGTDAYNYDDTIYSQGNVSQGIWDTDLIFEFKTNNEPQENSYELLDASGNVVYSRAMGSLAANTIYKDTFHLNPGCYRLLFHDIDAEGGDGLSFWANTAGGSGYARMKRINNIIFKSFLADFGSLIDYSFTVGVPNSIPDPAVSNVMLEAWPNPSNGILNLDIGFTKKSEDVTVNVFDSQGKLVKTVFIPADSD
ncbi:MAG TPA: peptide-N-glycosidase F-related protein, partial [Bacteroidia bacterium]|nr:peptide-N-glycosidase F-related protein [Bacteroidia bacterium]